jgi:thiamine kinase-like enzyme
VAATQTTTESEQKIADLACWNSSVQIEPLFGGITNRNFRVNDSSGSYFVRLGEDIPVHGVMRFNELAASRAAHSAGVSPGVVHAEQGILVLEFIQGKTLGPEDFENDRILDAAIRLVRSCHFDIPLHLDGPVLTFWVFQVIKGYTRTLQTGKSRMSPRLDELNSAADNLQRAVGPIELTFGHNDLLPANFIDDGSRLWLIDWDYAGFNSALFDLGGLASNNSLSPDRELSMLEQFYQGPVSPQLKKGYSAMKCASLLRESMWSMVSEIHSDLDFDFIQYTDENLSRFSTAYENFQQAYS